MTDYSYIDQLVNPNPSEGNDETVSNWTSLADMIESGAQKRDPTLVDALKLQGEAFYKGAQNVVTWGGAEELGGAAAAIADPSKSYAEHVDAIARREEYLKDNAGLSYGIGQTAGVLPSLLTSVIGGPAIASKLGMDLAGEGFKATVKRGAASAVPAAVEGGAYALLEGENVPWGMVGGGLLGGAASIGIEKALKAFHSPKGGKGAESAREELATALRESGHTFSDADIDALIKRLDGLGPSATLADLNETLSTAVFSTMTAGRNLGRSTKVAKTLRERNETLPESFKADVNQLFGGEPMTPLQYIEKSKEVFADVSPKYSAVVNGPNTRPLSAPLLKKDLASLVTLGVDSATGSAIKMGGQRKSMLTSLENLLDEYSQKVDMPDGTVFTYHTPQQLRALRDEVDGMLNLGKYKEKKTGQEITLNKDMRRMLSAFRSKLSERFQASAPGVAALDNVLSTEHKMRSAAELGASVVNDKKLSPADLQIKSDTFNSSELLSMANGAKYALYKKLGDAKSPVAKMNVLKDDNLRAKLDFALGDPKLVDGIYQAAEKYLLMSKAGDVATVAGQETTKRRRASSNVRKVLVEKGILAAAPVGVTSVASASGAAQRLADVPGYKAGRKTLDALDDMLSAQGPDAMQALFDLIEHAKKPAPLPFLGSGGFGSLGSSLNTEPD